MHCPRKACVGPVKKVTGGHAPYVVKFTKIQLKIQHYEVTAVTYLTGPT